MDHPWMAVCVQCSRIIELAYLSEKLFPLSHDQGLP
jgi:hypothetical protein